MIRRNEQPLNLVQALIYASLVIASGAVCYFVGLALIDPTAHTLSRSISSLVVVLYLIGCLIALRYHTFIAQLLLLVLYFTFACVAPLLAGTTMELSLFIFSIVILLSGRFMGQHAIPPVTFLTLVAILLLGQAAHSYSTTALFQTEIASLTFSIALVLAMAFVSWIICADFTRMTRLLRLARQEMHSHIADVELMLANEDTRRHSDRINELTALYRFAEIGRQSTAVLHDLSNHLAVLMLDIDTDNKATQASIKQTLKDISSLVAETQAVLQTGKRTAFNVYNLIRRECLPRLQEEADKHGITISLSCQKEARTGQVIGNPVQLRLVLDILVRNAIQAYDASDARRPTVTIAVEKVRRHFRVIVRDTGIGISRAQRSRLFLSPQTTKEQGHGIGLFVAKQIISHHYQGNLRLERSRRHTGFVIQLPHLPDNQSAPQSSSA